MKSRSDFITRRDMHPILKTILVGLLLLGLLTGCVPSSKQKKQEAVIIPPPPPLKEQSAQEAQQKDGETPTHFTHTVRWGGESLSIIAKWYTGDLKNWKALAGANPDLDPDRIRVGDKIRIPKELMKATKPLPRDFVRKHAGRAPDIQAEPRKKDDHPLHEQPGREPPEQEAVEEKSPEEEASKEKAPEEETPELFGPKEYRE
jgi:hypothetical protein